MYPLWGIFKNLRESKIKDLGKEYKYFLFTRGCVDFKGGTNSV